MTRLLAILFLLPLSCHAQFGSFVHDQPYLAQDSLKPFTPPDIQGMAYYWVASDLPDGTVTGWTDRISHVILTNSVPGKSPTKTGNYVDFAAGTYGLSNSLPTAIGNAHFFWWIASVPAANWDINVILGNRDNDYFGFWYKWDQKLAYNNVVSSWDFSEVYDSTTNDVSLFAIAGWNEHVVFTNGVVISTNDFGGTLQWPDSFIIGNANLQTRPLSGRVYEVAVFTNVIPYVSWISNLHWYKTNTYGGP